MTTLTDLIVELGAPGRGAPAPLRWMSDWLPDAVIVTLGAEDLARIDAYRGGAGELHELLPALPRLRKPVWFEAAVTAQGGTAMVMGYGAVPMTGGLDVGYVCHAPEARRMLGPLGPSRLTAGEMRRPADISDEAWRSLRHAGGIVLRGLLLGLHEMR